jgi:methylaspartate ammonia-lyase
LKIHDILFAPGFGSFYYDDQSAIRSGVTKDGFVYQGAPETPGFDTIRQPARSLGIGLAVNGSEFAWGDMMAVQYSGAGGRDPLFSPEDAMSAYANILSQRMIGVEFGSFRSACAKVFAPLSDGTTFPLAVQYGVSQALLRAFSLSSGKSMVEVICAEYECPLSATRIPMLGQSGDENYQNVDKLILKKADFLPHGLINSQQKFGADGSTFLEYLEWVAGRVHELGSEGYHPTMHFDLYGWAGHTFENDINKMCEFMAQAERRAQSIPLLLESPADFGNRDAQVEGLKQLCERSKSLGLSVSVVADEWCNTLEDIEVFAKEQAGDYLQIKMPDVGSLTDSIEGVMCCKSHNVGAYLGGSCTETDVSARIAVHVAVATQVNMMLAKPGMGVDEAITIVGNEQSRLLAELGSRQSPQMKTAG